ncbi:hypothetical protein VNO78_00603 [Psophocarpus tetragonolobus]|uniref:Uncharacterized protein n=1 Tax=Psophocarpus tetragonolobus TaxID=3891 RepID=A0AAN9T9I4_PSOTE
MAPSEPPPINVEAQWCPEAVTEWYNLTSLPDYKRQCALSRDLALQAKKHLCYLGWNFWHVDKKGRWELRYTSPITGKNYISLRRACQGCIEEGGCSGNPQTVQENTLVRPPSLPKKPRKYTTKTRVCKRRTRDDDESSDNDNDIDDESGEASSSISMHGKGKVLSSIRRTRHLGEGDSQHHRGRATVIPWLIDNNVVGLYSAVFCYGANNLVKTGKLWRSAIACDCCGMLFSPTRFEAHARCHKHRPTASIFLEDGRSLLDCQKQALSSQQNLPPLMTVEEEMNHREYQNDSICAVCRYGGELVLCDRCPSSFHLSCLGLENVPDGDWFCPTCCCKICKQPRCTQDRAKNVDVNSVLVCHQCEGKYHIGCLKALGYTNMGKEQDHVDNENWFCSGDCEKMFLSLQKLVGKAINVGADDLTWTLLQSVKSDSSSESDLIWDGPSQIENKLSVALSLLRECFDPVIDAFSGREMIADVVFSRGSELNRLNFRGFYTVVLEKDEKVVSVATIRIFGKRVAEIPFVATRMQCRRQGMCGILMREIEKQLTYLGVERLVLPSSRNVVDTWTKSFDFVRMTRSDKYQFLDYGFLNFEGTIMCHKPLVR